jgi:hypothetical protein
VYDYHTSNGKKEMIIVEVEGGGGQYMLNLDDEVIIESYYEAMKLNLDKGFISILENEIKERGLFEEIQRKSAVDCQNFQLIVD